MSTAQAIYFTQATNKSRLDDQEFRILKTQIASGKSLYFRTRTHAIIRISWSKKVKACEIYNGITVAIVSSIDMALRFACQLDGIKDKSEVSQ